MTRDRWLPALGLLAATILAMVAASPAKAAGPTVTDEEQMRFVVVRSNEPGCEPTCPEWISAEGTITARTPGRLKKILKELGPRRLPMVVTSPGGDVDAALQLGRTIRRNKLDIAVGLTRFAGCQPGEKECTANDTRGARHVGVAYIGGSYCASACPIMFAGGVRRLVGPWAYLGVHQITTVMVKMQDMYRMKYRVVNGKKKIIEKKLVSRKNVGTKTTYEMSKAMERKLDAYFDEMAVGRDVVDIMKATPASGMQKVSLVDMLNMKLVTGMDSHDALTAGAVCKTVPAAANCRVVTVSDLER